MKKYVSTFLISIAAFAQVVAQELICDISVIPPQVSVLDPGFYKTLESTIEEFVNGRKWTNDNFDLSERIECTMQFTIEQESNRQFKGSLQVGSSRPIYNSDYKSPVLSLNDRSVEFTFLENSMLQWSNDQHRDNLSSLLAFYAYLIIGIDYDTFSLEGGTDNLVMCQTIVSNAQNAKESGWKADEKGQQNRYWLIENMLSQTFKPLRECFYNYHRQGFDKLYAEADNARKNIADAILTLRNIHKVRPSSYNLQVFFYAKSDELVNLFKPTAVEEKQRVYELVKQVDPGNISKYENMMK